MPIDGEESMDMSAAADVAPEFEQLTVLQPTTDRRSTAAPVPTGMALSLVFPCYNEVERLPRTLAAYLAALPRQPGAAEVLVVDDGSTDQTFAVAQAIAAQDDRVRVIRSQPNHGKGFGARTGVLQANGALIVFTDASYGPGEVARVTAALADAPVAIGSRPAGWAIQLVVDALGVLRDVLRVRRWAVSGGYDRAVAQAADTCTAATLGPELRRATQPS
jgi:hypothetical protein